MAKFVKDSTAETLIKLRSAPAPLNTLHFTEVINLKEFQDDFTKHLVSNNGLKIDYLSMIPTEEKEELKDICSEEVLKLRTGEEPIVQMTSVPESVAESMPPEALEPTPQTSTLRSIL